MKSISIVLRHLQDFKQSKNFRIKKKAVVKQLLIVNTIQTELQA